MYDIFIKSNNNGYHKKGEFKKIKIGLALIALGRMNEGF